MRSVCLDCIISRCNDFNNFKCPLTGVDGVNVAGLKGSGFERERVKVRGGGGRARVLSERG